MNFHPAAFDFLVVSGCVAALSVYLAFVVERIDQAWTDSRQDRKPTELAALAYRSAVRSPAKQQ